MVIEKCVFCGKVIPKGQQRCKCEEEKTKAKCPRFRDRNDYQGVSRIGCGLGLHKLNIRFLSIEVRDEIYKCFCCGAYEKCRYFGLVTGKR